MMDDLPVSRDDLQDVLEMTQKLENYIGRMFRDNEVNLAMSALMSSTVNCVIAQCRTLDEAIFYRNLFMQILDSTIRSIKIKGQ
jgi:hypothetical protein